MFSSSSKDNPDYYLKRSLQLKQSDYSVEIEDVDFSNPKSSMIHWHWHEEIEFMYVSEGQVYITCDQDNMLASQGDIVFINQNVRHFITPANSDQSRVQCIIVHPMFIVGFGHLDLERKYITPILHDSVLKYLHITPKDYDYSALLPHIQEILAQHLSKQTGYELLTKAALLHVWKLFFDRVQDTVNGSIPNPRTAVQDEQRVKQAILYIQDHFTESISLEDIAGSILVSKSECCRCFKRALNMTPFEYLMKYRILESTKHMHRKKHESISEIASAVGFNNTSYYNKIFKKYMNCTPTEYRNSIKKDLPSLS